MLWNRKAVFSTGCHGSNLEMLQNCSCPAIEGQKSLYVNLAPWDWLQFSQFVGKMCINVFRLASTSRNYCYRNSKNNPCSCGNDHFHTNKDYFCCSCSSNFYWCSLDEIHLCTFCRQTGRIAISPRVPGSRTDSFALQWQGSCSSAASPNCYHGNRY